MASAQSLILPALNRPFALGMLYNCYDDTLIVSDGPWSQETLADLCDNSAPSICTGQIESECEDTISSKSHFLKLNPSLTLSCLAGLVNVDGSAKLLNDNVTSLRQERVSFHANYTTRFQRLRNPSQKIDFLDILQSNRATHFVAGIRYGANVVFVFDKWNSEEQNSNDASGEVEALIEAVSGVNIGITATPQLRRDIENASSGFKFKFYGDMNLSTYPSTLNEALEVLQSMSVDQANEVPIQIYLEPIESLNSSIDRRNYYEITENTIDNVAEIFEGLESLRALCSDLKGSCGCKNFPRLTGNIRKFLVVIRRTKYALRRRLRRLLPLIRSGRKQEDELVDVLRTMNASPVAYRNLEKVLIAKAKQSRGLTGLLECMQNFADFVGNPGAFESIAMNRSFSYVVALNVSTFSSDVFLDTCLSYLDGDQIERNTCQRLIDQEANVEPGDDLKNKAALFENHRLSNFCENNSTLKFIVMESAQTRGSEFTAKIQLYEGKKCLYEDFTPPGKPGTLTETRPSSYSIDISWKRSLEGSEYISHYEVECSAVSGNHEPIIVQTNGPTPTVSIKNLQPGTRYKVRYWGCTASCRSFVSDIAEVETSYMVPVLFLACFICLAMALMVNVYRTVFQGTGTTRF